MNTATDVAMARDTDDLKAFNAIRRSRAKNEAGAAVDEDSFTIDYHLAQADVASANAKRAHIMGVEPSFRFEAGQAVAHWQKAIALSFVKEAMQ